MTRVYTPDLAGIANLMSDEAAQQENKLLFDIADMLVGIATWHDMDESGDFCSTCYDHAEQQIAHWPCDTHQVAMRFALGWLMRRGV